MTFTEALEAQLRAGKSCSDILAETAEAARRIEAEAAKAYPVLDLDLKTLRPLLEEGSEYTTIAVAYWDAAEALEGGDGAVFLRSIWRLYRACRAHFGARARPVVVMAEPAVVREGPVVTDFVRGRLGNG